MTKHICRVKQAAQSRGAPPGLLDGVEDHIIAWIKLLNWEDTKEGKEQELKLINEYLTKFQCEIRFIVWGLKNKDVALEHKILLRKAKKYLMNRSIDTWLLERVHSLEDWFVERRQYRRLHQRSEG